MERLTERYESNGVKLIRDNEYAPLVAETIAMHRLAAYEDILFDADGNEVVTLDHLRELVQAEKDGRLVVLPCKVGELPDKMFSHNEIVALWYEKENDKHYSHLLWRGMAWDIPEQYKELRFLKIKGIVPERMRESDTINLLVTPPITPCAALSALNTLEAQPGKQNPCPAAEAALEAQKGGADG